MHHVPSLARVFLLTGLLTAAAENVFLVMAYDMAFENVLDRALFLCTFTALQTLLWLGVGIAVGCLIVGCAGRTLDPETRRGRIAGVAATLSAGILLAVYLTPAVRGFVPSVPGPRDWAMAALIALMVSFGVIALVLLLLRLRQITVREMALTAVALVAMIVAGWVGALVRGGPAKLSTVPLSDIQPIAGTRLEQGTNVLLIVEDTLRADHLSSAGYSRQTTPVIDRLAASGVNLTQTIAQATRTSPNMASLFTGLTTFSHGIISAQTVLDAGLLTWGEIFEEAGYRNIAIVANPNVGNDFQFTQGFDKVVELFGAGDDGHDAAAVYGKAVEFLDSGVDEPFLMWLQPIDPHAPYDPPAPYDTLFYGDAIHAEKAKLHLEYTRYADEGGIRPDARVGDITSWGDYIARYDGEIRYADAQLDLLLNHLEQVGLRNNTLIVFTSDHGESLGEHGYFFAHGSYSYEDTAHVPLILSHPALPKGLVIDQLVRTVDILPSVAALLGLSVPSTIEGESFLPLLEGAAEEPRTASVNSGSVGYVTLAARTDRYKLILTPRQWGRIDDNLELKLGIWPNAHARNSFRHRSYDTALYDLLTDAAERNNLAGSDTVVETVLHEQILSWVDSAAEGFEAVRPGSEELDPRIRQRLKSLGYVN